MTIIAAHLWKELPILIAAIKNQIRNSSGDPFLSSDWQLKLTLRVPLIRGDPGYL